MQAPQAQHSIRSLAPPHPTRARLVGAEQPEEERGHAHVAQQRRQRRRPAAGLRAGGQVVGASRAAGACSPVRSGALRRAGQRPAPNPHLEQAVAAAGAALARRLATLVQRHQALQEGKLLLWVCGQLCQQLLLLLREAVQDQLRWEGVWG